MNAIRDQTKVVRHLPSFISSTGHHCTHVIRALKKPVRLIPSPQVAEALKSGQFPDPEPYPCVSIFFSDVVGYTELCSKLAPQEIMDMLHRLYSRFDTLAQEMGLFKGASPHTCTLHTAVTTHTHTQTHTHTHFSRFDTLAHKIGLCKGASPHTCTLL